MEHLRLYYKSIGINLDDLKHPISSIINGISTKNEIQQESTKLYLKVLGLALMDIREYDKKIYKKYSRRIKTCFEKESIYGHIFEIIQCSHFIDVSKKENLSFKFGDANKNEPDFIFNDFGFEITTSRFSDESDNFEPAEKLLTAFRKKNKKHYVNNETALLIDITNISERAFGKSVSMSLKELCKIVNEESRFGVVLCFTEWVDKETLNTALVTSSIIFSDDCNPNLKTMIETVFFKKNNITAGENYLSKNK
jgi:hypothetical protein